MAPSRTDLRGLTVEGLMCEFAKCYATNLRAKWRPEEGAIGQIDKIYNEEVEGLKALLQAHREKITELRRERDGKMG